MIRLLLVDDLVIFRQGLAALISLEPDIEVVGEAGNGEEAILLAQMLRPDVILMDVRMPICNGVEATKVIHQKFPWIRIMVLTTFDEDEYICQSLQNGALGYILKSTPSQQLATTIRSLDRGFGQLDPAIALKVFSRIPEQTTTQSEKQVGLFEGLNMPPSAFKETLKKQENALKDWRESHRELIRQRLAAQLVCSQ